MIHNTSKNCGGTGTSHGYNPSSDNTCDFHNGGGRNNINPKLGTLGDYGGPTPTIPLLSEAQRLMLATRVAAPTVSRIC